VDVADDVDVVVAIGVDPSMVRLDVVAELRCRVHWRGVDATYRRRVVTCLKAMFGLSRF
jgi:hypothetical protein